MGAFHLLKISGISGSAVNGTRFVGSSHWKIPRKSGKSKKVVPFSRLEFPNGISCSIYVSRSSYQFQVHGRAPPRTGVYDQMEQLFTNRKFHFCYHRHFRVFFLNGKRPVSPSRAPVLSFAHYFQAPAMQATVNVNRNLSNAKNERRKGKRLKYRRISAWKTSQNKKVHKRRTSPRGLSSLLHVYI